jgi:molybdopterin synthase sulfur carrier subunit
MKVKFRFFGPFREIAKIREIELKIAEESNIFDALNLLIEKYGTEMRKIIFHPQKGSLKNDFQILVNGKNIYARKGVKTTLKKGDIIIIYPPVAGG